MLLNKSSMKLYTYYTDSHRYLFETFLKKSINYYGEYELNAGVGEQRCSDGGFCTENFGKTCFEKIKFMIESNEWESNEIIMFCDSDVIFLNKTKEFFLNELGKLDMIFQNDDNTCNTGIYLCRKNKRVKSLLENVLLKNNYHNEQVALNDIINNHDIKYKLFDYKVWNVKFSGIDPWDGQVDINFPPDILMYHANYMLGTENKKKALQLAFNKFFI